MTTTAGQAAFDAERDGLLLGGRATGIDELGWRVYAYKDDIIACVFDGDRNTGAYDVIDPDRLAMYVENAAAVAARESGYPHR